MELLVGVLLVSVAANAALFFWLSRADHVKVHWPRFLQAAFTTVQTRRPMGDVPTVRRRSLYVAEPAAPQSAASGSSHPFAAPSGPIARGRLTETLPPDLAEFLSRPAALATAGDSALPGDGHGFDGDIRSTILARLPAYDPDHSTGMELDPLTDLEGPASWSRIIEVENARLLRYRRPVTVVVAEVEGLRRLAERLGEEPVERLLPVIADAFRREARSSDWVARISGGRFAAFLPETDEIQAINYVERIRMVCEPWLASSAVPLRLAIGWSSPAASSDIEFALARAEERMHADRRIPGKPIQTPRVAPARVVSLARAGQGAADSEDLTETMVAPAETGRVGGRTASDERAEEVAHAQSGAISRGKGRRKAPPATT
jgi:diguanylate cyclase (GGDEF)-like protein